MNLMPDMSAFLPQTPMNVQEPVIETEQILLGVILNRFDLASEIVGKLQPGDLCEPLHAQILDTIANMLADQRTVTVPALLAAVDGDQELAEGLTVRDYILRLGRNGVAYSTTPVKGLIEVLQDARVRRELHALGNGITLASTDGRTSIADLAADAVARLDDVIAATRKGRRRAYDGAGAADLALEHLAGKAGRYAPTGLVDLDRMLGGWPRGQLSILAGRPGMGKSAAASTMLLGAAKDGFACMYFSLEMTGEQLGARMLTDLAFTAQRPIYYEDILKRTLDGHDVDRLKVAREKLAKLPIHIEEQRGLTMAEIGARARKHAAALDRNGEKLEVIFVDHMLLVKPSKTNAGNRVREVAEISDALATLAKDLDVAVVALCQLNRSGESQDNKRPTLVSLRDSGSIEEDARTVTFVYRPAYYLENTREDNPEKESARLASLEMCRNKIEFVVAKNSNGQVGVVKAWCNIGANAIRNAAYGG